jgi:hypothetical protein
MLALEALGQTENFIVLLFEGMPAEVVLVQALHHDHPCEVVPDPAGGNCRVPPLIRGLQSGAGGSSSVIRLDRVINENTMTVQPRSFSLWTGRKTGSSSVVGKLQQ